MKKNPLQLVPESEISKVWNFRCPSCSQDCSIDKNTNILRKKIRCDNCAQVYSLVKENMILSETLDYENDETQQLEEMVFDTKTTKKTIRKSRSRLNELKYHSSTMPFFCFFFSILSFIHGLNYFYNPSKTHLLGVKFILSWITIFIGVRFFDKTRSISKLVIIGKFLCIIANPFFSTFFLLSLAFARSIRYYFAKFTKKATLLQKNSLKFISYLALMSLAYLGIFYLFLVATPNDYERRDELKNLKGTTEFFNQCLNLMTSRIEIIRQFSTVDWNLQSAEYPHLVFELINHPSAAKQAYVIRTLGKLRFQKAMPALIQKLQNKNNSKIQKAIIETILLLEIKEKEKDSLYSWLDQCETWECIYFLEYVIKYFPTDNKKYYADFILPLLRYLTSFANTHVSDGAQRAIEILDSNVDQKQREIHLSAFAKIKLYFSK
ncbi:HEAT repeat domain-containing protein [Candidatus Uabimicrobium sp. HlEnr_7]|uniref:HEAT repeat domain-containing protein n=1 Tax=Candidatus Uabimicrobium helgolandensis TaxID=3095367 RepID=UPI0035576934